MDKIEPRTLPGFMELLPSDQIIFNKMKEKIQKVYERYGFLPIDTPVIESSDVLLAKAGGETEKQIYRFNKGDNDLALRFDLTVPLAKYMSLYYHDLNFPFKRYQIGKVYRGEKAQKGRYREFYQCDIDIIGDNNLNIIHDAEIPSIIYDTFKELGFEKFTIHINNRKILNGLFENLQLSKNSVDIMRIIDKIEKIGKEAVITELEKIDVSRDKIDIIMNLILSKGTNNEKIELLEKLKIQNDTFITGKKELEDVVKYIRMFKIPESNFVVDFTIARGLDYYTGTVYETFLDEYKALGSICSGGRYDNLAEHYTDKKLPGVGISIGLSRFFYQLKKENLIKEEKNSVSQVVVIPMKEDLNEECIEIANKLRKSNINVDVYLEDKKFKNKFKYTDKLNIPYAIVIGEEEANNKMVSLKNMQTGDQETLTIEDAIERIKDN